MREIHSVIETKLPPILRQLALAINEASGTLYLVGGCVRDAYCGIPPQDWDAEVFGLPYERIQAIIANQAECIEVGKSFGIFKLKGHPIDIALPRWESSTGEGHRDFLITGDPHMTPEQACLRRDFTCNALLYDPLQQIIIDPLSGINDLQQRQLRQCSSQFGEDPLRVLRAMQMIARFELQPTPQLIETCQQLSPSSLSYERIGMEWKKLLLQGQKISLGLDFLQQASWLRFFPELAALVDCPQDPEWHPEGDVWTHTQHCLDAFARQREEASNMPEEEQDNWIVGLAVLCHDLGKASTTFTDEQGRIRSPMHEKEGESPTRSLLARFTREKTIIEAVVSLVTNHMKPHQLYQAQAGDSAIRRLALRVHRIDLLVQVAQADTCGRPPIVVTEFPESAWLLQRAEALAVKDQKPQPILQGRHLIAQGLTPGLSFKDILEEAFAAQLAGEFHDLAQAKNWLRSYTVLKETE